MADWAIVDKLTEGRSCSGSDGDRGASVLLGRSAAAGTAAGGRQLLLGGFLATIYRPPSHAFDQVDRSQMVAANSGMLLPGRRGDAGPLVALSFMAGGRPACSFIAVAIVLALCTRWRMTLARQTGRRAVEIVPRSVHPAIAGAPDRAPTRCRSLLRMRTRDWQRVRVPFSAFFYVINQSTKRY
jgi:hypothetical protein